MGMKLLEEPITDNGRIPTSVQYAIGAFLYNFSKAKIIRMWSRAERDMLVLCICTNGYRSNDYNYDRLYHEAQVVCLEPGYIYHTVRDDSGKFVPSAIVEEWKRQNSIPIDERILPSAVIEKWAREHDMALAEL